MPCLPACCTRHSHPHAQVYKKENKNLMSSYDDWLKNMVRSRPNAGSSGAASPQ